MKTIKIFALLLLLAAIISCTTAIRDPAQSDCNPKNITNAGTHFDDYERCEDL